MPHIPDNAAFQNSLASLPLVTYQPGETVIVGGSKTGRLLILKKGNVAVVKDDIEIAKVAEPGAVFGELSVLLDQPHTADVHALETSQFHIANATALLSQNAIATLYVATVLAHRLDGANHALVQLKNQLQTREAHSVIAKTVSRMEGLLAVGDEFIDDWEPSVAKLPELLKRRRAVLLRLLLDEEKQLGRTREQLTRVDRHIEQLRRIIAQQEKHIKRFKFISVDTERATLNDLMATYQLHRQWITAARADGNST